MELVLLTGFLGAGKTTLLNHLLKQMRVQTPDRRVGVIVNEFGKSGIDGRLVRQPGVDLLELNNGSVFCACIRESFIHALKSLTAYDLDLVLVEASGLSDPSNIGQILDMVNQGKKQFYAYRGAVCVLDAVNFLQQVEVFPAIRRQIECSGVVVINKTGEQELGQLKAISRVIAEINGKAVQLPARFCQVTLHDLLAPLLPPNGPHKESLNTVDNRPRAFVLTTEEMLSVKDVRAFLEDVKESAFRMKGFVRAAEGFYQVSSVNRQLSIEPWEREDEATELVVISSVGVKILRQMAEGQQKVWGSLPFCIR